MYCSAVKNFFPDVRQYCALITQSPERPSTLYEVFCFMKVILLAKHMTNKRDMTLWLLYYELLPCLQLSFKKNFQTALVLVTKALNFLVIFTLSLKPEVVNF